MISACGSDRLCIAPTTIKFNCIHCLDECLEDEDALDSKEKNIVHPFSVSAGTIIIINN